VYQVYLPKERAVMSVAVNFDERSHTHGNTLARNVSTQVSNYVSDGGGKDTTYADLVCTCACFGG
jgi:hypothetical protein